MTFSGINQWILCTSSGGKFHLTPPNSANFPLGFHPQNPPPAMAYRFESGHRHQKQGYPHGVSLFLCPGQDSNPFECNGSVNHCQTPSGRRLVFDVIESGHRHRNFDRITVALYYAWYYFLIKILILIRKASPDGAACFVIYKEKITKQVS